MSLSDNHSEQAAALHKLFIRHTSALRGYLLALMPNEDAVDDVLQATFLVITSKAAQFDTSRDFAAWARGIARIELLRYKRAEGRTPRSLSPEVIEKLSTTAPSFHVTEERAAVTSECIDELAPRTKQSLVLRYKDGLRLAEIARRMDVAVGTVKAMLSRARCQIRKCVERKLGIEGRRHDG